MARGAYLFVSRVGSAFPFDWAGASCPLVARLESIHWTSCRLPIHLVLLRLGSPGIRRDLPQHSLPPVAMRPTGLLRPLRITLLEHRPTAIAAMNAQSDGPRRRQCGLTRLRESVIVKASMSMVASELVLCGAPQSDASAARVTDDVLLPLVRRTLKDDAPAVSQLVHCIAPRLLRTVRQVMGAGHPDIEDVTQDAVIGFLRGLAEFRAESTVLHFAHRIGLLTALAARRRLGTRERRISPDGYEDIAIEDQRSSPHVDLLASRRRRLVRELLDDLPESIAEAMAAHFVLGLTVDEIAATSRVPANTVWSRLRLGKAAMRKRLRRDPRLAELLRVFE